MAAQIASTPLDRSRPLWELYVVEGLADGNIGVVTKMHHCAVDGVSGAELMVNLFDLEPERPGARPARAARSPSRSRQRHRAGQPRGDLAGPPHGSAILPLLGTTAQTVGTLVSRHRDPDAVGRRGPAHGAAHAVEPRHHARTAACSFTRVSLDDVKTIKNHVGCTVNDVVLGLMGGTLRRYLEAHDAFPDDRRSIAVCPVSVRTRRGDGPDRTTRCRRCSPSLATDVDDPIERLRTIHEVTKGAKEDHNVLGANLLQDWAEHAAPTTFALAARLYSSMNLSDRHRPIHNVVISNVPGPPFPLYFAGAKLEYTLPMGPVMEGAGLNITVLSYMDNVDIGFMACRELVPDVWSLADYVEDGAWPSSSRPSTPIDPADLSRRVRRDRCPSCRRCPSRCRGPDPWACRALRPGPRWWEVPWWAGW